jgi:hypothetical protein
MTSLPGLHKQSLLKCLVFPHCQHTSHPSLQCSAGGSCIPIGVLVTSCSVASGPAVAFAVSSSTLQCWPLCTMDPLFLISHWPLRTIWTIAAVHSNCSLTMSFTDVAILLFHV